MLAAIRPLQAQNVIEIQEEKRSASRRNSAIERIKRCLTSLWYALVLGQDALLPRSFIQLATVTEISKLGIHGRDHIG